MDKIKIRRITINDIHQLKEIGIQTFLEAFGFENHKENMNQYLSKSFSIKKLKSELQNTSSEFYFAEINNKVLGYLKINVNKAQTEIMDSNSLEIERIYVLDKFTGNKIGQHLLEKVLEISVKKKITYIWLGVWEKNSKAIRFYKRNGFLEFDKHIFKIGNDKQTDILMKLKLV